MTGEIPERRVDQPLVQLGIARQREAENGGQQQQQGEEGEQAVVGDQCRLAARLVVAELLQYRPRKANRDMVLLEPVGPANLPLEPATGRTLRGWSGHHDLLALYLARKGTRPACSECLGGRCPSPWRAGHHG